MKSQPQKQQAQFFEEDEVNLRDSLARYLKYWPWFIISVILCILIAFIYLRYSTPVYHSKATIIIKDEKRGGVMSELSSFEDMGILSGMSTNNLDNEIGILWSRKLITNVVEALQLNIRYFIEGEIKDIELYNNTPLEAKILSKDDQVLAKGHAYEIYKSAGKDLKIINIVTKKSIQANYGEPVDLDFGTLVFERQRVDSLYDFTAEKPLRVHFTSSSKSAGAYREKINVELTSKNSSFIELGLNDPIKERGRDVLDQLIFEYNKQSIEDKNLVAKNTAKFIEGNIESTRITSTIIEAPTIAGNTGKFSGSVTVGHDGDGITVDGTNKRIYIGDGSYNDSNTPFYVSSGSASNFSLGDKLTWNGSILDITGVINANYITTDSGSIGG
jgi:hypothetical protein